MAIALYAPALAMSQASGIPIWASIVIAGIVGTFYTTMGGMRAVVWTDVFQVCVMVAGTLALIIGGTIRVGGLDKVWNINMEGKRLDIFDFRFGLTIRQTFWSTLFGYGLSTMAMHAGSQTTIQRWMSVKNVKEAQITTWLQIPLTSLFQLVLVLQGMVMYAFYHKCDPLQTGRVAKADQLSPLMSIDILGAVPGLPGLFLSAIVCAALSTLSSGINSMSAVVLEDVVKPWYMWKYNTVISDRKATLASKIASGIFGMLAVALAIPAQYVSENVIQFTNRVYSMNSGPVFGLFIVAMFFPWTNSIGAFVGVMTSLVISYWIGLGALIDGPSSPKLPLRIDGCGANNTDVLYTPTAVLEDFVNITMDTPVAETSVGFQIKDLYTLSYLWFTLLGLLVTIVVGLVVSFISGHNKSGDIPENLLFNWSSCLCWRREKSRHSSEPMSENGYNNNALISTNSSLVKQPLTGKDADLDNITRL
ncbi:unnamed protein product [Owenia fusiformis]|nr:unnamed protein product [Owenia fusiformis]